MAMGSGGSGGGLSSDINVTPMIDVLLVLLIIFMITLPLSRRDFDVQVPPEQKNQPKQKQQQSDQIVLELRPDGSYAVNTQPVPFEQLEAKFHELYDQRPAKLLFIRSAPNRKYGDIVRAMDIARGAGGGPRGGGGGGGRPAVSWFALPTPSSPIAAAIPPAPTVTVPTVAAPVTERVKLDMPPPAPTVALAPPTAIGTGEGTAGGPG